MKDNTPSPSNSEEEIDLKDLIIPIWNARKQILIFSAVCGILGGIIGFLTPATYTASSTFLPQTMQAGGVAGSLGGLAALAGINLNSPSVGGDIPPTLYARVLRSEPFRKRILDSKIWVNGDTTRYRDYLESYTSSWFEIGTIKEYTIGVPGKLLSSIAAEKKESAFGVVGGLQALSDEEFALHNAIASKVKIDVDKQEGLISITVIESDPMVAAEVVKVTEKVLQNWIIDHKINNAKAQYDFIEKQFEAKQKEFFSIQDELAGYMDRNQNVLSATYLTRLERLQAEFDLINTVYSELAKQKEQAAIQLSKDTPTFSVLDPVKVPKEKTGPKKTIYVLGAFFIGLILSASWYLARNPAQKFFKGLQTSK